MDRGQQFIIFGQTHRQQCENVCLAASVAGIAMPGLVQSDIHDALRRRLIAGCIGSARVFGTADVRRTFALAGEYFSGPAVNYYRKSLPVWTDIVQRDPSLVRAAVAWLVGNRPAISLGGRCASLREYAAEPCKTRHGEAEQCGGLPSEFGSDAPPRPIRMGQVPQCPIQQPSPTCAEVSP
jgi:hypothetical protein